MRFFGIVIGTTLLATSVFAGFIERPTQAQRAKIGQQRWIWHNDATLEVQDPYWIAAKTRVSALLASGRPVLSPTVLLAGSPAKKQIALTFDDGPHQKWTNMLLDTLRACNVKGTFFLVGKQVRKFPNLAKAIAAGGHEIGNHSFSHATMSKLSLEDVMTDYLAQSLIIKDTLGFAPKVCRPPGGKCKRETEIAATALNMSTIFWTSDPLDYKLPGKNVVLSRMLEKLEPGAIFLLHSGSIDTIDCLPEFVKIAKSRGYSFVLASDMLPSKPNQTTTSGKSTAAQVAKKSQTR